MAKLERFYTEKFGKYPSASGSNGILLDTIEESLAFRRQENRVEKAPDPIQTFGFEPL